ncbi:unnamed protein product [Paramecium sonneborni]|uniref:Uncharacterized protein n=1 Tax=Paramecium sonneborni TaxID=65129 RepID=A0A8S1RMU4_9CILI|nr:unnamed protein product [Paramecium sonneborni]
MLTIQTPMYQSLKTQIISGLDYKPLNQGLTGVERAVARRFLILMIEIEMDQLKMLQSLQIYINHSIEFLIQFKIIAIFLQNFKQKLRRQNHVSETQRFIHQISNQQTLVNLRSTEANQSSIRQTSQTVTSQYRRTQF